MRDILKGGVATAVMALAWAAAAPAEAQAAPDCAALTGASLGDHGKIDSATLVAADAARKLPDFCEVKATLHPVAGSTIGVVYRLPSGWNGKVLGSGGGGWMGNVTLGAAMPGLQRGYATAQTDAGHPGTPNLWDNSWAANPEAAKDFAYRGIHEMTVAAKQLVRTYYGKPQTLTYYQGCSTGGRMGLMEAQRFPGDYDGIIAGAPVYTLQVQTSAILRNNVFAKAAFTNEQLQFVQASVLKACGGEAQGYLDNPRACKWDPVAIQCKSGETAQCLTPAQVRALRTAYAGIRASDGSWAAFPLEKGGEAGWFRFVSTNGGKDATNGGGLIGLKSILYPNREPDWANYDPSRDVLEARRSDFAKMYEAGDPNIDAFVAHGGKLILWHGESDGGPSPEGTIDYYNAIKKRSAAAAKNVRVFLAPGTEHCGGGPGPNQPDTLTALEQWIEQGRAPETVIATNGKGLTRPLCPYPAQTRYSGGGDLNDPKNYRCS